MKPRLSRSAPGSAATRVGAEGSPSRRFVVGVDLGTSHCAAAWARMPAADAGSQPIALQQVPIVQPGVEGRPHEQPLLPSALYFPRPEERTGGSRGWSVGRWAQQRAQETRGRSVVSAKSWLSHAGVDRLRPLLPFGSQRADDVPAISPVAASVELLTVVRRAVLAALPGDRDEALWVLTVPASFDESARQLTLQAASAAGLEVSLLEEPQAAFYDALPSAEHQLEGMCDRHGTARVLVCDLGGGTSDFTLLLAERGESGLSVRRTAVGAHLLLGGDNMDLALAASAERRLSGSLSLSERGQLVIACRQAKEVLLSADAPESFRAQLVSQGSRLLGELRELNLTRQEVEALVLDGFFPKVGLEVAPLARRAGLRSLGLPYERDPSITSHLAQFLRVHSPGQLPHAVLFNGGVTASQSLRTRLLEVLAAWAGGPPPVCLQGGDASLAVCRGAVRYGLALQGRGLRVGSGTPASFYVAVAGGNEPQVLCVLPKGSSPGKVQRIARTFRLRVGGEVRFEAYRCRVRSDEAGALVPLASGGVEPLPSLRADLRDVAPLQGGTIPVVIRAQADPRGFVKLELEPTEGASGRLIELAFELTRLTSSRTPAAGDRPAGGAAQVSEPSVPPPVSRGAAGARPPAGPPSAGLGRASADFDKVFGKLGGEATPRQVKDLTRTLEKHWGPRGSWSIQTCRALSDALLARWKGRLSSAEHERVFWMLLGYALRPGFGWAGDPERVERAFSLFPVTPRLRTTPRHWQAFWVAWRRVAAGLVQADQEAVFARVAPLLAPVSEKLKRPKAAAAQLSEEVWRLAAHLERLPAQQRARLGGWVLDRSWADRDPVLWTHLGRIGARVPLYVAPEAALEPFVVERWVEQLMGERWSEIPTAVHCAVQLCRKVGDPARDIDARLRAEVVRALQAAGADEASILAVNEGGHSTDSGSAGFEEALPLGLHL